MRKGCISSITAFASLLGQRLGCCASAQLKITASRARPEAASLPSRRASSLTRSAVLGFMPCLLLGADVLRDSGTRIGLSFMTDAGSGRGHPGSRERVDVADR